MATIREYTEGIKKKLDELSIQCDTNYEPHIYRDFAIVDFPVKPTGKTTIDKLRKAAPDIGLAIKATGVTIETESGFVYIRVPVTGAKRKIIYADEVAISRQKYVVGFGKDVKGSIVKIDFASSISPHVLICATTGGGKTALAHTMLENIAATHDLSEARIILIDPKGERPEWLLAKIKKHLAYSPAYTVDEAIQTLAIVQDAAMRRQGKPVTTRLFVYIDELANLLLMGKGRVEDLIKPITSMGRTAGLHVIACTQNPNQDLLGVIPTFFPARICGSVTSSSQSQTALGQPGLGAERLMGEGDMIIAAGGVARRFQAAIPRGFDKRSAVMPAPATIEQGIEINEPRAVIEQPSVQAMAGLTSKQDNALAVEARFLKFLIEHHPEIQTDAQRARIVLDVQKLEGYWYRRWLKIKEMASQ